MNSWQIALSVAGILSPFVLFFTVAILRIWYNQGRFMQAQKDFKKYVTQALKDLNQSIEKEISRIQELQDATTALKIFEHEQGCSGHSKQ